MLTPRQIAQTLNLDDVLTLADGALDLAFEHFNELATNDPELITKLNAAIRLVERVASIHKTVAQIHATFNQSPRTPDPSSPHDPSDPSDPSDQQPLIPPSALRDIDALKKFMAEHRPSQKTATNPEIPNPNSEIALASAASSTSEIPNPNDEIDYSRRLKAKISDLKFKYMIPAPQRLQNALDSLAAVNVATPKTALDQSAADSDQPAAGAKILSIARPIRPLDPDAPLPDRANDAELTDRANAIDRPRHPYTFVPDPANQSPRACPTIDWQKLIPYSMHTVTLAQDLAHQEITADPNWALNRLLAMEQQHKKQLATKNPETPKEFPKNTPQKDPKAPSIQNAPVHIVQVPPTPPPDTS